MPRSYDLVLYALHHDRSFLLFLLALLLLCALHAGIVRGRLHEMRIFPECLETFVGVAGDDVILFRALGGIEPGFFDGGIHGI